MKSYVYWILAVVITLGAAYYQRVTGPTKPKRLEITVNGQQCKLKMVRSIGLDEPSEIKLALSDTTVRAKLFFHRYPTKEEYQVIDFQYKENKEDNGFYASIPQQPAAGKIQYYFEITDSKGTVTYMKETPIVIRFKGGVPAFILLPHVLLMFVAMLFSTLAGLMSIGNDGVQHVVPCFLASGGNLRIGDGIVVKGEFRDKILGIDDILDAFIFFMLGVHNKKHILIRIGDFSKNRYHPGLIAVSNIIFGTIGKVGTVGLRIQFHIRRINIRTMFFFRQSECAKRIFPQLLYGLVLEFFIISQKNRIQSKRGNMVHIPIGCSVKTTDF